MKHRRARKAGFIFGDRQVRTMFGWLKRKPNLELVNIEDKLDQLSESVTNDIVSRKHVSATIGRPKPILALPL